MPKLKRRRWQQLGPVNGFSNYVLGRAFQIESDHKPVTQLETFGQPAARILRFRLRMARFDYVVQHVPGKLLYTADALSRAPVDTEDETTEFPAEVEAFVDSVIQSLPATSQRLEIYRRSPSGGLYLFESH